MAAIRVADYARTRNHLEGAVTRLSPYLTHGFIDVPDVVGALRQRHADGEMTKLLQELAWREYFQHVQRHLGEGIFKEIRPALAVPYAQALPPDIIAACTGVPVIDHAIRALYATGYLHNHARMWLASYIVHLRKISWRAGADWMYAHLLDGDLASNHLSWQWCAGTFSSKPYLFNADNVERFAPAWRSPGTAIDCDYEQLERIARSTGAVAPEAGSHPPTAEPPRAPRPPLEAIDWPLSPDEPATLVHPWDLGDRPRSGRLIGVIHLPFHERFAWSDTRWTFVLSRLGELCSQIWVGDLQAVLDREARTAWHARMTFNPGYREALTGGGAGGCVQLEATPRCTPDPDDVQPSFSAFWRRAQAHITSRKG